MDAFSHFAFQQHGCPHTLTINWPGWREVGILAEWNPPPGMAQWKADALEKAISTEDGIEAFRQALDSDYPQLIVYPEDLNKVLDGFPRVERIQTLAEAVPEVEPFSSDDDDLEALVAATWSDILGIPEIGRDESFFELGGHSLLAMQTVAKFRSLFNVEINLREFFEAPTVAQLSVVLREKLVQEIDQLADHQVLEIISEEPVNIMGALVDGGLLQNRGDG